MTASIDYSGDDYPRTGCRIGIDVQADGYRMTVFALDGRVLESYAKAASARAIGRMVEEWCAGFAPRLKASLDVSPSHPPGDHPI
ncbi:hypothetical protein E6C76_20270 [Pseudothauera nasutitermitis]|uniref:Uncharacterized protein n=1 Tax=Pseudothauera nasutitermitis TaxID=2565930 RepID=A0A4S4AP28_9RHOO|nr:hypothetical protein [Pseudothauera nasutitermitis]THF61419.1 hypothetical protein E6C76_20270 [Pseudothauera nasutitermitis]